MLNGKADLPQGAGVILRSVPGAEGYEFFWSTGTRRLTFRRLPDGPDVVLAQGVPGRDIAGILAQAFGAGLTEASTMRMCRWPPEAAA